jgi:hypothetical protein
MKVQPRFLFVAIVSSGLVSLACASGEMVGSTTGGGGGKGGGSAKGGSSGQGGIIGGNGGSSGQGQGGIIGSGQGGIIGSGQGGSQGGAGSTGFMATCVPTAPLISDMESGLYYFGNGCPQGSWNLASKGGGMITAGTAAGAASGNITPVAVSPANPMNPTSTMAIHVAGVGQANSGAMTYDAYVSISASLDQTASQMGVVNAAAYSGVQFWGKINAAAPGTGTSQAGGSVRLQVAMNTTDGAFMKCTKCDDDPGAPLMPSTSWMLYKIPFSSLMQEGFGDPVGFQSSAITKILWKVEIPAMTTPTPMWDIWIDDLSFY